MERYLMREVKPLLLFRTSIIAEKSAVFLDTGLCCGFPSPADDFLEERLSLDEKLIKDRDATFYAKVDGSSMIGAGLEHGDLLVIDRSIEAKNNSIAVCHIDGGFTVKRLKVEKNCIYLMPENPLYDPICIDGDDKLIIWGVVSYVIKKV